MFILYLFSLQFLFFCLLFIHFVLTWILIFILIVSLYFNIALFIVLMGRKVNTFNLHACDFLICISFLHFSLVFFPLLLSWFWPIVPFHSIPSSSIYRLQLNSNIRLHSDCIKLSWPLFPFLLISFSFFVLHSFTHSILPSISACQSINE